MHLPSRLAPFLLTLALACGDDDDDAGDPGGSAAAAGTAGGQGGGGQAGAGLSGGSGQSGASQAGAGQAGQGAGGPSGQAGAGAGSGGAAGGAGAAGLAGRRLGLEINPPDPANSYGLALDVARSLGVSVVPLTLPWSLVEEVGDDGVPSYATGKALVAGVNQAVGGRGMGVMLSLPGLDTVATLAPADLREGLHAGTLAWDDPLVVQRYDAMLDQVLGALDPAVDVVAVMVGNEVDVHLQASPALASPYLAFVTQALAHVHQLRPQALGGVNLTHAGIIGPQATALLPLVEASDAVFVSYYASGNLGGDGQGIAQDIGPLLAFSPGKPLLFKEYGYATGTKGASATGQAAFVEQMFSTWQAHADRIPVWVYSRFYDGDPAACAQEAVDYGFPGDKEFEAFLCTLGLYTFANQPKPAWTTFQQQAATLAP